MRGNRSPSSNENINMCSCDFPLSSRLSERLGAAEKEAVTRGWRAGVRHPGPGRHRASRTEEASNEPNELEHERGTDVLGGGGGELICKDDFA